MEPVILSTSNGVGMGHLTRQVTLALTALAEEQFEPVLFSLSGVLPTVASAMSRGDLPAMRHEFCPSRKSVWLPPRGLARRLRAVYPAYNWEPYFADRVVALVQETGARAVVHDGVVAYAGLLAARRRLPGVAFVWVRRGFWKPSAARRFLDASSEFDLVVEPGDFAGESGPTAERDDATRVAPVSITAAIPPREVADARAALGLDPERKAVLVAPSLGAISDVATSARAVLNAIPREWQVAVTSPALARHGVGDGDDRVVALRGIYPLAPLCTAFDAAISGAGYNAVHELLGLRVPTLLLPTPSGTDDQAARSNRLAERGLALAADPADLRAVAAAVGELLNGSAAERRRADLAAACAGLPAPAGAHAMAQLIGERVSAASSTSTAPLDPARFGPPGWRSALPDPRTPLTPLICEDLPDLGDQPVEHLIAGASPEYRRARQRAAAWLYR
ncbi:MAG: hypothetical protein V9G19_24625 [Tetrasphaera sp.]